MTLRGFTNIPGKYFRTIIQLNLYSFIKYKINILSNPSDCDGYSTSFFSGSVCHAFRLRAHFNELFERIRVHHCTSCPCCFIQLQKQLNTSLKSSHHSFKGIHLWALLCNGCTYFHKALCILANLLISRVSTATVWSLFFGGAFGDILYRHLLIYVYCDLEGTFHILKMYHEAHNIAPSLVNTLKWLGT